jgi:hypothetical protein
MLTSVAVLVATLVNSSVAEQDPQFKKEELEALQCFAMGDVYDDMVARRPLG